MLDDFDTKDKVRQLFAEAKLPKGNDKFMIAYSTWPTTAMILGGAGTQVTADVDSAYGGYLVQICDNGLNLLPLARKNKKNGTIAAAKMDLSSGRPIHLDLAHMVSMKNHMANGLLPFARDITILMDNKKKYVWFINKKERNLPYHEEGFQALLELGKKIKKR